MTNPMNKCFARLEDRTHDRLNTRRMRIRTNYQARQFPYMLTYLVIKSQHSHSLGQSKVLYESRHGVCYQVDLNRPAHLQRLAKVLKFWV